MPGLFDGKDAWWLFGRPVARLRDIEPLFTSEVMANICSSLNHDFSIKLRDELIIAAGYYLFSKQLHANRRPSRIRGESREFKNAMEKILDPATNMSTTYYFYLMFASGQIMQLAEDNKLAPVDDDSYQ